jgi:hypothetical protein
LAEQLLNEVSAARICLLDGKAKARYDKRLKAELESAAGSAALANISLAAESGSQRDRVLRSSVPPAWYQTPWAAAGGGALVMLLVMLLFWPGGEEPKESAPAQPVAKSLPPNLEQGLVAYYPFNGNANDESGNGHHGLPVGEVTFVADRQGNSKQALGTDGRITIADHDDFDLGTAEDSQLTISLWFNAESGAFLCKQLRPGSDITSRNIDYRLYMHAMRPASHTFGWGTGPSKVHGGSVLSFSGVVVPGTGDGWNHLVVTYSQTVPGSKSVFFDGGLVYLAPIGKKSRASNLPLNIGPVKGPLDDVRIYNRALSAAEVKALYEFEKP